MLDPKGKSYLYGEIPKQEEEPEEIITEYASQPYLYGEILDKAQWVEGAGDPISQTFLYGEICARAEKIYYHGYSTDSAQTTVDGNTIKVDISPDYVYHKTQEVVNSLDISGQIDSKVEQSISDLNYSDLKENGRFVVAVDQDHGQISVEKANIYKTDVQGLNTSLDELSSSITSVREDLSAEASLRSQADINLTTTISNEVLRATKKENQLEEAINNEIERSLDAEALLQEQIDSLDPFPSGGEDGQILSIENNHLYWADKDIFIAIIYETPLSEILEAIRKGQIVVAYDQESGTTLFLEEEYARIATFSRTTGKIIYRFYCTESGWSQSTAELTTSSLTNDSGYVNSTYVNNKISELGTVLNFKGTKETISQLPVIGNNSGDVWIVTEDDSEYVWNGIDWEKFGPTIDLSGYVPITRTINGKALNSNLTITANDVGALPANTRIPTKTSDLTNDSNFITSSQVPVQSVNGQVGDIVIDIPTASDLSAVQYTVQSLTSNQKAQARTNIGAGTSSFSGNYNDLTNKPTIPSKTSQLTNDSGFINTETDPIFSASPAATITTTNITSWNNKGTYSKPSSGIPKIDLASSVQDSLTRADTALQNYTETDPTVPSWAKQLNKPTYTAQEVGALPDTTNIPSKTSDLINDSGYITIEQVPPGSVASSTLPIMDGVATTGSENAFARGDHVHPSDTSRVPITRTVNNKALSSNITLTASDVGAIADPSTKSNGQVLTYNGTSWVAQDSTGSVSSVNSKTGAVVLDADDVGAQSQITASGILKGNGSGTVTAAIAGTDYVAPSALSKYVPLSKSSGGSSVVITDSPMLSYSWFKIEASGDSKKSSIDLYIDKNASTQSLTLKAGSNTATFTDTSTTIKNVVAPTNNGDAANKQYVDDSVATKITDPSTKSSGQVLTYNGTSWEAQTPSGGSDQVFIAQYGVTTYAEVLAAYNAGEVILAKSARLSSDMPNWRELLVLTDALSQSNEDTFVFQGIVDLMSNPKLSIYTLTSSGWTSTIKYLATTNYVDNAINTAIANAIANSY